MMSSPYRSPDLHLILVCTPSCNPAEAYPHLQIYSGETHSLVGVQVVLCSFHIGIKEEMAESWDGMLGVSLVRLAS